MPQQTPNRHYDDKGKSQPLTGGDPPDSDTPGSNPAAEEIRALNNSYYGSSAGYDQNNPASKAGSRAGLAAQEGAGANGAAGQKDAIDPAEQSFAERLRGAEEKARSKASFFRNEELADGKLSNLRGRLGKIIKKRLTVYIVTAVIAMAGALGFSIVRGPMEFLQFAKLLEKFHLRGTQDFGDSRASKVLLYTLAGAGERGKLGITANIAADRWEKRVLNDLGIRPVFYDNASRHHAGWEVTDLDKARSSGILTQMQRDVPDAQLMRAGEINGLGVRGKAGARLSPEARLLYYDPEKVSAKDKRIAGKAVTKASGYSKLIGAMAFRLEKKRLSINLHPLNGVKQKRDARADAKTRQKNEEEFRKEQQERRAKEIEQGVRASPGTKAGSSTDANGNQVTDATDVAASDESNKLIDQFKTKGALTTAFSSAAVIGVFCAAKSFGTNVEDYKYQNNAVPMMRMGANVISMGSQIQSGKDVTLDELGAFKESFYDKETKTSWMQAESIQAELGKKGGQPLPDEAQLKNINDKPKLFDTLDSIPVLGTACDVQEGFFGLPVIKQVSGAISSASMAVIDTVLSAAGTSSDKLMTSALKAVSGKSVNALAKGAEFGGLANTGAFLAGNDHAVSMGGGKLSGSDVALLREEENLGDKIEKRDQSITERYFALENTDSLVGSVIINMPDSSTQIASFFTNPFKMFGSLFSNLSPAASAATGAYDYGIEKYGFSVEHQNNPQFEDPYAIARKVEPELTKLNEKYGKCFGITVSTEGKLQNEKAVNVFDISKDDECDPNKNTDNLFNHYRFYLADTVAAKVLACKEKDEEACAELDGGSSAASTESGGATGSVASGSEKELAQKLLDYKKQGKYNCDNPMDCEDLEFMVQGKSIKGGVGCVVDKLDKRVMQIIIYLIENNYKIGTYALCCSHSYNQGAHPQGKGLDISSINGKSLGSDLSSRSVTLEVDKIILELNNELKPRQIITAGVGSTDRVDPDFVKFNRVEPGIEGQAAVAAFGSGTMNGHDDHIHVGY